MQRITLRQLTEMFQSLPDTVLDKPLGFLDIGHIDQEELENLKKNLLKDENDWIQQCS